MVSAVEQVESELRDFARLQARAGLADADSQRAEVAEAIRAELPQQAANAEILARAWLAKEYADLAAEAASWSSPTDVDRLDAALAECEAHQVLVLRGVAEPDATTAVAAAPEGLRGALWFAPTDVWRAVDQGILATTLWRPDGRPAAVGEHLHTAVTGCLGRHGLAVRDADGRVEVACRWQRRP